MNKALSISMTKGNVAINHDRRAYIPINASAEQVKDNVYIKICENLHETFNEIFAKDVFEYNEKQSRSNRKIKDYYEKY